MMKKPPIRLWVGLMIFFTTFTTYMTRVNLSVSIVAMSRAEKNVSDPHKPDCPLENKTNQTAKPVDYNWNEKLQGLILGAYFWGYIVTCLPAGIIAEFFGPCKTIFYSSLLSAILNSITPYTPIVHYSALMVCRFVIGALSGLIYPAIQILIARWSPPSEKGKFLAAMMGNTIGIVTTWPLVGILCQHLNYQWSFHVVSIFIGVYSVVFFLIVSDSPDSHKCITQEEKDYITEQLAGTVSKSRNVIPPYLEMIKSIRFWALAIAQFGNLWGLYLVSQNLPKFLSQVYGVKLQSLGFISSIPYVARFLSSFVFGSIGDYIKKRELVNTTLVRKFFIIFSHVIPGLLLGGIVLAGCNFWAVIALVSLAQGINGAVVIGHLQNPQDLAPNYASSIYGIISFIGGTTGFIVPAISGAFTDKAKSFKQWSYVFELGGTVYIACGIVFIILGTAELQPWNAKKPDADE